MTAAPMTAVAVGTTLGWFALRCECAATATTTYDNERLGGTSTASYTHEWRRQDVGSDESRPMRRHVSRVLASEVMGGRTANRVHHGG